MLDELFADERADVGVIEDRIEAVGEILFRRLAARQHTTLENQFGTGIVIARERYHRALVVDRVSPTAISRRVAAGRSSR
jgi:hypothetical protein